MVIVSEEKADACCLSIRISNSKFRNLPGLMLSAMKTPVPGLYENHSVVFLISRGHASKLVSIFKSEAFPSPVFLILTCKGRHSVPDTIICESETLNVRLGDVI